jgi:hypothetical protein
MESSPSGYDSLMKKCWHADPKKRPLFSKIKRRIGRIMDSVTDIRSGSSSDSNEMKKGNNNGNSSSKTTDTVMEVEMSSMRTSS